MSQEENLMKKRAITGLAIVAVLVVLLALLELSMKSTFNIPAYGAGTEAGEGKEQIRIGMEDEALDAQSSISTPPTVSITREGFVPNRVRVTMGDTIIFTNNTGRNSQLYTKSDAVDLIREVTMDGDKRILEFKKSGEIDIVDVFNKGIKLTVYVQR